MKRSFLRSPVDFGRVSSEHGFRMDPFTQKIKKHGGTDYAAPLGTPIRALADGLVLEASYTSGNGNYIKIKHSAVYQTQYLHMQKFAEGVRANASVKMGQVIGYVGSTGRSTGPHVCLRFKKRGKEVDFRKEPMPLTEPIPGREMLDFMDHRDTLVPLLKGI